MTTTTTRKVQVSPLPSGSHLSSPFAQSILQAQQGGASTQQFLQGRINDQYELQGLVNGLQGTPTWIDGTVNGYPASYYQIGSAFVAIATTPTNPEDAQKVDLSSAVCSQTIHVAVGTNNATTVAKLVAGGIEGFIAAEAYSVFKPIVDEIVDKLKASLVKFMLGAPETENVNGQGEPNDDAEGEVQEEIEGNDSIEIPDYGTVEFEVKLDLSFIDRLTTAGTKLLGALGFVALNVIVYFVVKWLTSIIFKSFNVQLNIYNLTTQSLSMTMQYTHDIEGGVVGQTSKLTLGPVGSTGNSPFSGFQPTDPVISYANFTLTNNVAVQGLGILMELKNVTGAAASPAPDPNLNNVILTLDVPYNGSNSMSAWFNETSTDWEQLYSAQEGVNTGLAYQNGAGDYTVYLSTNAVSGANDDQYVVNAVVADTATYKNFSTYAAS